MTRTEDEIVRRREVLNGALATAGLTVGGGVIERAVGLDFTPEKAEDADSAVARHGEWFMRLPADEHLPYLLDDFANLDVRSQVYLAAMVGESLSTLDRSYEAMQWFRWAGQHQQSPDQAAWLHGRNSYLALDADLFTYVRPGINALGSANYAKAQAKLGYREEALVALNQAGKAITPDHGSVFDFPVAEWHQAGSSVHTRLGNPQTARDHQIAALDAHPDTATTARALLNLDVAERIAAERRTEDASTHLYQTMASLPRGYQYGIITRRAEQVYDKIPA